MNDDDMLKNFSNYLLELGFLNYSTYKEFSKKYDEISQRKLFASHIGLTDSTQAEIDKKNITDALVEFYNSLQEERKQLLAINVFDKYIKKSEKENVKESENNEIQLSNLDDIIMENNNNVNDNENNRYDTNKKIEHVESFNIPGIKKNKTRKEEKNDSCFTNFIQLKKNRNKSSKYSFSYQRPKKIEENEKKIELNEHCTFQPNANKTKNKLSKDEQEMLIERLYKRNDLEKKNKLIEDIRSEQDKENIFQPNFKKGKSNLSRKNFEERLKHFEEVRLEQKENRIKEEEKQFKEKFPFAPKRKNSTRRRNNSMPKNNIYQKLYEDNARKKERQNQNLKQIMNELKNRANHPITTHNNIDYIKRMKYERNARFKMYYNNSNKYNVHSMNNININDMENKEMKKSIEFNRIEELYKEYKKIKEEMNLRKKNENNEKKYNEQYNIDNNEIDGEDYDYNNDIENNYKEFNDDKPFNYDNIDDNISKEANFDNNIEMNDDDDDNNSKEENIENNKSHNICNNSIENNNNKENNNNENNNSKEHNNEDNYEEDDKGNNYEDIEQENDKDNENSFNQNVDFADKDSVEDENEIQNK